jgi:hypothetical protein
MAECGSSEIAEIKGSNGLYVQYESSQRSICFQCSRCGEEVGSAEPDQLLTGEYARTGQEWVWSCSQLLEGDEARVLGSFGGLQLNMDDSHKEIAEI